MTLTFIITIFSGSETSVFEIENSLEIFIPEIKNDYGPTDMLNGNINLVIGSFLKMIIASKFTEFIQVFLMFFFSVFLFLYIFNRLLEKNNFKSNYFEFLNCILLFIYLLFYFFLL